MNLELGLRASSCQRSGIIEASTRTFVRGALGRDARWRKLLTSRLISRQRLPTRC